VPITRGFVDSGTVAFFDISEGEKLMTLRILPMLSLVMAAGALQ